MTPDGALNVVGEQITVLASGAGPRVTKSFSIKDPRPAGRRRTPTPGIETFYVIDGEVEFGLEKKRLAGQPGTLVHLPAGTIHWFRLGKGGAQMLALTARLAASRMFADISR